jgi:crotonobetainyl-CoA:carnitine CoA-transferase CaiB-like acyl-CoA transferase
MPQVLEGLRVVDVTTGPVGGIATMVLADFGADVIKIEPPGGDRFRSLAAAPLWLRGKRSVTADLKSESGRDLLTRLVPTADVLVVGGPPSRATRWGIDADAALRLRPGLVHCSITGWGPVGPRAEVPAYEGVVAARTGRMRNFERQLHRGGPVFAAVPVASHMAAQGAVQGMLAALTARARGGGGQRVETSLLQSLLPYDLLELLILETAARRGIPASSIPAATDMPTLNYHPVRTQDGRWIQCGNLLEHLLMAFLETTDLLGDLLADPRFSASPAEWDRAAVEVARDMILVRLQERTADEWMARFRANGNVAAEPFITTVEALYHPDLVAGGDIVTIDDPARGPVRTIGPVAELTATPACIGRPAPGPGQHTAEVVAELEVVAVLEEQPPAPAGAAAGGSAGMAPASGRPLEGITVVEFATIIAAPLSTVMLADLGARVIKVESVDGDPYRHLTRDGSMAAKTTAGKQSICVDLKSEEGHRIALELAQAADVVLYNTRPGVADRLGLGEADVRAGNPGVVWVSVTGYGRHSPGARRPATHPCAGAASGGATLQAGAAMGASCDTLEDVRETSRQLMRANDICPDPISSAVAASAVLLGLLARERFGIGQAVYVNMIAANMYAMADEAVDYAGKPSPTRLDDQLFGPNAGYRLYPAAEGWVFLALTSDGEWRRALAVMEQPDLADDPRYATGPARSDHDATLAAAVERQLMRRPAADWEARFAAAGVAGVQADAVGPGAFFAHDPQMLANDFAPECLHLRFGTHRRWGPVVRVNGGLDAYRAGVLAGQQTDEILLEMGRSAEGIAALRAARVVASEPLEVQAPAAV